MKKGKLWTDEELTYLEDRWGIDTLNSLVVKLGRSEDAILVKANRIGLSKMCFNDMTLSGVCKVLGVSKVKVLNWEQKGLKIKRRKLVSAYRSYIDPEALLKFLEKHQDEFDASRIESYALGKEPEWLKKKRFIDLNSNSKRNKTWTKQEESKLIALLKAGKTQPQIAEELGRTPLAIENKVGKLRKAGVSLVNRKLRWSDKEWNMVLDLELQGLADAEIALELGRCAEDVTAKRKRMRKQGKYPYETKADRVNELKLKKCS